jgi:DNA-binding transcriptional LysR family regulator
MDTLQNMRVFARVIESGSFTAAAISLNSSTGAMSRAVSELEEHLRTRLMTRSTRKLSLTPAGERYLKRCLQILADIDGAEAEASGAHEHASGTLRMFSFASVGQHYILPAIARYRQQYPDVSVELMLSQRMPDLFEGSSDVAIVSAASLPDSEMVSQPLGATFSILCASPEYVRLHGAPQQPRELTDHPCVTLLTPAFPANEWTMEGPDGVQTMTISGPVQVNIAESLVVAIREGLGIGMLPLYAAVDGLRDGSLVRVLDQHILQKTNLYALYASRRFVDAKTRTWIDFLRGYLPAMIARDEAILAQIADAAHANTPFPLDFVTMPSEGTP